MVKIGLDMYLTGSIFLWSNQKELKQKVGKLFPEFKDVEFSRVSFNAGYWRKAYAIHDWFVDTLGWEDENTSVSMEVLQELKEVCKKVLKDKSKAKELLPTHNKYDEWYFRDLQDTINIVEKLEKLPECNFSYSAG